MGRYTGKQQSSEPDAARHVPLEVPPEWCAQPITAIEFTPEIPIKFLRNFSEIALGDGGRIRVRLTPASSAREDALDTAPAVAAGTGSGAGSAKTAAPGIVMRRMSECATNGSSCIARSITMPSWSTFFVFEDRNTARYCRGAAVRCARCLAAAVRQGALSPSRIH
jgi:hypothetical protein